MRSLLLFAALAAISLANAQSPSSADRFDALKAISGHWLGHADNGHAVTVDYAAISRGSVLVENWQAGTPRETMSVFHRDGDRVMATHYCGQGNQPRLLLQRGKGSKFVFRFLDATNLPDEDASHLVELELTANADGSLDRVETYRAHGKDATSHLHLESVGDANPSERHGS
jgi:hypothetical protein